MRIAKLVYGNQEVYFNAKELRTIIEFLDPMNEKIADCLVKRLSAIASKTSKLLEAGNKAFDEADKNPVSEHDFSYYEKLGWRFEFPRNDGWSDKLIKQTREQKYTTIMSALLYFTDVLGVKHCTKAETFAVCPHPLTSNITHKNGRRWCLIKFEKWLKDREVKV